MIGERILGRSLGRRWLAGLLAGPLILSPAGRASAQGWGQDEDGAGQAAATAGAGDRANGGQPGGQSDSWEEAREPSGSSDPEDTEADQPPAMAVPPPGESTPSAYQGSEPADLPPAPVSAPGGSSTALDADPRALSQFHAQLDPYGTWSDDPNYGTLWFPRVPADFGPYRTGGYWDLDQNGNWVWASDYPWGAVTFHYGRWVWIGSAGWGWIPGYRYAPAWVVWSAGDPSWDYLGWAPAPPSYGWWGGAAWGLRVSSPFWFFYVPRPYVFHHDLHRYLVHDWSLGRQVAAHSRLLWRPVAVQTTRGNVQFGRAFVGRSVQIRAARAGDVAARWSASVARPSPATPAGGYRPFSFARRGAAPIGRVPAAPGSPLNGARYQPLGAPRRVGPTYYAPAMPYRPASPSTPMAPYRPTAPSAPSYGPRLVAPRSYMAPGTAPAFSGGRVAPGGGGFRTGGRVGGHGGRR